MGLWKKIAEGRTARRGAFNGTWEGPFDIGIEEQGKTQRFARSQWNAQEAQAFNDRIMAWGAKVAGAMPASISSQGIGGKKLKRSVKNNYYYEFGEIFRVGFSFARQGIFVHKGVGRGYVMNNGTVVKTSKSEGFNRDPKPWFNPVIEAHIAEFEQIIKDYTETAIINSARIYIR